MADQTKFTSKLRNKKVLIIGGSSGIGYAVAEAVLEYGGSVVISSSSTTRVDAAVKSLKTSYPTAENRVTGYSCDTGNEFTQERNIIELLDYSGVIDHLVYTAGDHIPPTPISEATLEKIRFAERVRYLAPIFVAKHASKYLKSSPESSITLTTGIVTEKPIPGWSVIAGARSAVLGLGKALALDLKPVRVNVVSVGAVDTDTWSPLGLEQKENTFRMLATKTTTGRIAQPADVAEAYIYCMRDSNVTGSVISTNGGPAYMASMIVAIYLFGNIRTGALFQNKA